MKTIDLDLLQTIVAFADSGTCKGAAKLIFRSESAVSIKLKKLEEDLGANLFVRSGRKIELNERGRDLVSDARRILKISGELIERATSRELTGTVRLGVPDDYIALLPGFLSRFSNEFPSVSLYLHCAPTVELKPMLTRGELDLSILSSETDTKDGMVLQTQPVFWVTSEHSNVHFHKQVPLALFPEGCIFRKWAINALASVGREYKIAYMSAHISALQAVVQAGLAVSPLVRSDILPGTRLLGPDDGFPALSNVTVMVCISPTLDGQRQNALALGLRDIMLTAV
ncbi:LysR substrate-binding domain-containing protein [Shinella zoogloeoides]|uniref:LysR substrate-binding domain-containing protein n=1 Tax=Shinella zoogloeoides TaxID=352475 RepID=UPI000E64E30B|nr:LysR substrate-binding domain-containing protein [Shinella zoogloeoides]